MENYSADIRYAYTELGLDEGVSLEDIREVLENASSYRYRTKARLTVIRQFVEFFEAREILGGFLKPSAEIKKIYRQQAMGLHPDRNLGNKSRENKLKEINVAYARVEEVGRQAKDYYKLSDTFRREHEAEARETTERERPHLKKVRTEKRGESKAHKKSSPHFMKAAQAAAQKSRKYMAVAVPRTIRTQRLGYLPLQTIIGSQFVKKANDISLIVDIIVLPELQFLRAKSYLSTPDTSLPSLQYGKFTPPYSLRDVKEVIVPAGTVNAEEYAKTYFRGQYGF